MKLSIITITYNCEKTIVKCLDSMISQTYDNIEYIIVDGGSTDQTLKIVESYSKIIDKLISEPDEGIYDALNKGIRISTGDVIGFLHSDDVFANNKILENIMRVFISFDTDVVYGDIEILKDLNDLKPKRKWISKKFHPSLLALGWMPAHTSLFVKTSLYSKFGYFNTSFSISGDYDFILRIFKNREVNSYYMNETIVKMLDGGVSNKNFSSFMLKSIEDFRALKINKIRFPFFALLAKKISKITQFKFFL